MSAGNDVQDTASLHLKNNLNEFQNWLNRCIINVSEAKSNLITFILGNENSPPVTLNHAVLAQVDSAVKIPWYRIHIHNNWNGKTHI